MLRLLLSAVLLTASQSAQAIEPATITPERTSIVAQIPASPYGQPEPYQQRYPAGQTYQTVPQQQYPSSTQYGQPYSPAQQGYPGPSGQTAPSANPEPAFRSPWREQGPLIVPPISFVDVNSGRFGKLEIDLEDGQFMQGAVDRLHFVARNMDLAKGSLASLDIDLKGGHFEDFTCDRLTLSTQEALSFDSGTLFNHRMLQFTTPAHAKVTVAVTQASLNRFLNSPRTLDRLSVNAVGQGGLLGSLLGSLGPNAALGLSFTGANLSLQPNNRVLVTMQSKIGMAQMAAPLAFDLDSRIILKDGWVNLTDTRLLTSGQEISPELSTMVVNKVNALSAWGAKSDDIRFVFTDLKVIPGDRLVLTGVAEIKRLRF